MAAISATNWLANCSVAQSLIGAHASGQERSTVQKAQEELLGHCAVHMRFAEGASLKWSPAPSWLLADVVQPHKALLFVDNLLCALVRESAPEMLTMVVLFFCAISAPISWKKTRFVWCGWKINFAHDTIQLMSSSCQSWMPGSQAFWIAKKCFAKRIELLIWATSVALHLRSWLAPLYSDFNSLAGSIGSMRSIPAQMLSAFRAKTAHSVPNLSIS